MSNQKKLNKKKDAIERNDRSIALLQTLLSETLQLCRDSTRDSTSCSKCVNALGWIIDKEPFSALDKLACRTRPEVLQDQVALINAWPGWRATPGGGGWWTGGIDLTASNVCLWEDQIRSKGEMNPSYVDASVLANVLHIHNGDETEQ